MDRIGGVMASVLTASAMVRGFESRLDKTKYYNIDIWNFSIKHTVFKSKNKDGLAPNMSRANCCSMS